MTVYWLKKNVKKYLKMDQVKLVDDRLQNHLNDQLSSENFT